MLTLPFIQKFLLDSVPPLILSRYIDRRLTIENVIKKSFEADIVIIGGSGVETAIDPKLFNNSKVISISGTGLNYFDIKSILELISQEVESIKRPILMIEVSQILFSPEYLKSAHTYDGFESISFQNMSENELTSKIPLFWWRDIIRIGFQYHIGALNYDFPLHFKKSIDESSLRKFLYKNLSNPEAFNGHTPFFRTKYHYDTNYNDEKFIQCEKRINKLINSGKIENLKNQKIIDSIRSLSRKVVEKVYWLHLPKTNLAKVENSNTLMEYLAKKGENIIDLGLNSDKMYVDKKLVDCIHFNEQGREEIAKNLYEKIITK